MATIQPKQQRPLGCRFSRALQSVPRSVRAPSYAVGCGDDVAQASRVCAPCRPACRGARLATTGTTDVDCSACCRGVRNHHGDHPDVRRRRGAVLEDRAALVSAIDRPVLPRDDPAGAPGTVAHDPAGVPRVDPTSEGRALQDALRRAIATRRGYCWRDIGHAGWVGTLDAPERHEFSGRTLEEALAWCLVWLMAKGTGHPQGLDWGHELRVGPFRVRSCRQRRGGSGSSRFGFDALLAHRLVRGAGHVERIQRASTSFGAVVGIRMCLSVVESRSRVFARRRRDSSMSPAGSSSGNRSASNALAVDDGMKLSEVRGQFPLTSPHWAGYPRRGALWAGRPGGEGSWG